MQWFVLIMGAFFAIDILVFWEDPYRWTVKSIQSPTRSEAIQDNFATSYVGTVEINGPHGECRRFRYDNRTAESLPLGGICDPNLPRAERGGVDGAGRMEEISKYFSAR
jgi:hypothetical protein